MNSIGSPLAVEGTSLLYSYPVGLSLVPRNRASVTLPLSAVAELRTSRRRALEAVVVDPMCEELFEDFLGYVTLVKIAHAGGSQSAPGKAAAARQNGGKDGRKKRTPA